VSISGHVRVLVGTLALSLLLAELVDLAVQRRERLHELGVRLVGGACHLRGGAGDALKRAVDGFVAIAFGLLLLGVLPHLACGYAHGDSFTPLCRLR
jgi:hypothetical protein